MQVVSVDPAQALLSNLVSQFINLFAIWLLCFVFVFFNSLNKLFFQIRILNSHFKTLNLSLCSFFNVLA